MTNGYCLMVRDYKAEIVEFATLGVAEMPDGSKLYQVITKFGEQFFNEGDLHETKEELEQECTELNKALCKPKMGGRYGIKTGLYKPR